VNRWWRSHSLRMRLTLWHGAAMMIVLGVYMAVIYAVVSRSASHALDEQIRSDFWITANLVFREPDGSFNWMPTVDASSTEELPWVQVWSADGTEILFQNIDAQRRPLEGAQLLARTAGDDRIAALPASPVPLRVLSRRGNIEGIPVVIQVARSEAAMRQDLRDLLIVLLIGLPLAVAVAGLGAYWLARRALAPVERMTERAQLITAERLGERLPVHNPDDEMGQLATVFNETLGRLEASFEQMRRFTADVSHELRTPLTAIRSVGEVGLRGQRDAAAYRTIIGSMLEESDRLASLVDRLLTLSRAETGQARLSRDTVQLESLVDEVVAHLSVLAEEKGQTIEIGRHGAPSAIADRLVLRQALINLVDNAIKFTPEGRRIRIDIAEDERHALIDVRDSGAGIPEDARTRIFDRFYRAEAVVRGSGLGLSIARGAVEANGGHLTLHTTGPEGSTFRIAMPRHIEASAVQNRRRAG
jgi:heavy metal sensor kinase